MIGAFILLFTGIGSRLIMGSMFLGGLLMAYIFNLWDANLFMSLPAIHQLCIGGFFFGMVFMATDPVSATQVEPLPTIKLPSIIQGTHHLNVFFLNVLLCNHQYDYP